MPIDPGERKSEEWKSRGRLYRRRQPPFSDCVGSAHALPALPSRMRMKQGQAAACGQGFIEGPVDILRGEAGVAMDTPLAGSR
jgi:hypothetical protein